MTSCLRDYCRWAKDREIDDAQYGSVEYHMPCFREDVDVQQCLDILHDFQDFYGLTDEETHSLHDPDDRGYCLMSLGIFRVMTMALSGYTTPGDLRDISHDDDYFHIDPGCREVT